MAQSRVVTAPIRVVAAFLFLAALGLAAWPVVAQPPLDSAAISLRSHLALQALDRYSKPGTRAIRSAGPPRCTIRTSGRSRRVRAVKTPEEYAAGVDFADAGTGWHHSEWSRGASAGGPRQGPRRRPVERYTEDGAPRRQPITYIVTNQAAGGACCRGSPPGRPASTRRARAANQAAASRRARSLRRLEQSQGGGAGRGAALSVRAHRRRPRRRVGTARSISRARNPAASGPGSRHGWIARGGADRHQRREHRPDLQPPRPHGNGDVEYEAMVLVTPQRSVEAPGDVDDGHLGRAEPRRGPR